MRILFLFPDSYVKLIDEILQENSDEKMAEIKYEKYKAKVNHFHFLDINMHQEKVLISRLI